MPRSSRHKSSKHSSREARDYSDSEKDSGLKEKKGRDDGGISNNSSRHAKESASGEKRKLESKSVDIAKEPISVDKVDYVDEYGPSSSKKRKDKVDDDRWTGGDNEHELSKSDSRRSSRRDESIVTRFDGDEGKRSGSKVESKSHRPDRKEKVDKEGAPERERKGIKSERSVDGVLETENAGNEGNKKQGSSAEDRGVKSAEDRGGKSAVVNTDFNVQEELREHEPERELDRRVRRKRDGSSDGDKHQDGVRGLDDRRLSSREDVTKLGKYRDDGPKDERIRDKYREDVEKDHLPQDERYSDIKHSRDYTRGRCDDKQLKNEKKDLDMSEKKSKPYGSEYDRERDRDRDHDRDKDRDRGRHDRDRDRDKEHDDRDHELDRDRDPERGHDREREPDWERERGRDRYRRERERDRIRDRDHHHDRSRDRDRDYDHDHDYGSLADDKGPRYKDDKGRRRSPDGYDDFHGDRSRRTESEVDKERSLSRKGHVDSVTSGHRRRSSPSSRSYVSTDKYRDGIQDDVKYGDSLRDGTAMSETNKAPKFRSGEKRGKFDDNHIGDLPERSPGVKISPTRLKERSPSTTSVDRRFRTGRRGSFDVDESERRSSGSNDLRDVSINEDRQNRDFSAKKPLGEDYPRSESSFHHKSSQGIVSSHGPSPSGFRAGADSPSFMSSVGDDNRGHSGNRYRRSTDPNVGRGPGNAWKGVPNWPSPLPNGFMHFPPGPPGPHHGGFPPMLSQFPPLFGVRPPLEMNHPGIPYHMTDADRFPGHVRPMGWQNMVDGSVPPHFHGWDANNGMLRDESSMYGPGHLSSARGRDINEDMWKPNGNMNVDITSGSQKDACLVKTSIDEAQCTPRPHQQSSCFDDQGLSFKMNTSSGPSTKEFALTPAKVTTEETPELSSVDDTAQYLRAYLADLDISIDMADPELYNQCIDIAVKGPTEYDEEDVELGHMEGMVVAETELTDLITGLRIFPIAKDSIFQRALDLYKTQSNGRTTATLCNGEKLLSLPASQAEVVQSMVSTERVDDPVDLIVNQESPIPTIAEVVQSTAEEEGMEITLITTKEVQNGIPSSLFTGDGDGDELPDLDMEKLEENNSGDLAPENDDKGRLVVESIGSEAIDSIQVVGGIEPTASDEEMDVKVSEPLILSNDPVPVKVCEVLTTQTPVTNASESVILSRIHDAPESTH